MSNGYASKDLALTDPEHLSATRGANALCRWLAILHGYSLGILHLLFGTALYAVCLHLVNLLFWYDLVCTINYSHP